MQRNGVERAAIRSRGKGRALVREQNERIAALQPSGMFIEFACECGRGGCTDVVVLGYDEYEAVRRCPGRFAVSPGHRRAASERVVEAYDRYAVVEPTQPTG